MRKKPPEHILVSFRRDRYCSDIANELNHASAMKIFFDSEFTHFSNPRPIILGLISEDGREFYREISDSWDLGKCSLFVVGWILPLLSDGFAGRKLSGLLGKHLDLIQYLTDVDNQCPRDGRHLVFQELERDKDLDEHYRFLQENPNSADVRLARDRFLEHSLQGVTHQSLLSGEQVESSLKVVTELNEWLLHFGQEISLVVDSDYDSDLLLELYAANGQAWPRFVGFELFDWGSNELGQIKGILLSFWYATASCFG